MEPGLRGMLRSVAWTRVFLILGLALRLYHYGRGPSVWHDEAALILNVLGKNLAELLGPLFYAEAAPPLFLWVERAVSLFLGDSTWALRLVPLLASCAALVLVAAIARRVLRPEAVPWAVLLLACSDNLLWHSCEAKPYALDVLAATVLLGLFCGLRNWPLARQLCLYAALAPCVICISYPGCFLYGGLLVALLPAVIRERRPVPWLAYGLLLVAVGGAFLLLLGPVHAQRHPAMDDCWLRQFPHWEQPWTVPLWMLASTADVVRYCFPPTGHALTLLVVVGTVVLWRAGQRPLVVLLLLPLALALLASCIKAYPYGGARVEVYAAPALALLVAAAIPVTWAWLRSRSRYAGLAFAVFLLVPMALAAYRVACPWPRADSAGAAAFVIAQRQPDDVVTGNIWQDWYYFRGLGAALQPMDTAVLRARGRLWLLWTEQGPQRDAASVCQQVLHGGRVLARRDFTFTTVFLCEPESGMTK